MAGRQPYKLAQVRSAIGASQALPLIVADATDAAALARLVGHIHTVITTVGPYLWGRDFQYDERLITGAGRAGEWAARSLGVALVRRLQAHAGVQFAVEPSP